ncbi:amidohydrolase family protein [Novipirellula artificiosorum]|uniref:amidohydrolase family protein n=1 Tax=Novipirellula artificiosorum TaxID=2528016 RepID=UPI001E350F68|nr:amidohydrolase family protein [Novipirellula artificiosorum]
MPAKDGHFKRKTAHLDMRIDSHHHVWKYSAEQYTWISEEMAVLRHDFWGPQLREIALAANLDGFVSVQARQTLEETDTLLRLADTEPLIRGVVGWVPLVSPELPEVLARYADCSALKGVRHVVQDEPDDQFLLRADFNRGIRLLKPFGLVYDLLIFARQLPAAIEFVDLHPEQPFVLDHIAKPTIQNDQFDQDWEVHFRELAKRDNVVCKFSGVVTEVRDACWDLDSIRRYFDIALEVFTPKRLMFGSDWPVCLLKTEYLRWLQTTEQLASHLSTTEQAEFFANAAINAYTL